MKKAFKAEKENRTQTWINGSTEHTDGAKIDWRKLEKV